MTDFESLLAKTLQDVSEAEPLAGMEVRVMTRIAAETPYEPRRWLIGGAIAAAVLAAVLFQAYKPIERSQPAAASAVITPALGVLSQSGGRKVHEASLALPGRRTSRRQGPHLIGPRNTSIRIVPIVIEPLRMDGIQVALLTPNSRNSRGEAQ